MKRFASFMSAALAVLLLVVQTVPSSALGSSALSINPRQDMTVKPGSSQTSKLVIGNLDNDNDLQLSLRVVDFTFTDQSGTPRFNLAQNAPRTAWSLKPFITLPSTLDIPAGGSKSINYTVKIPKNQGAGSYYSAILYQAAGANGGNVALNASGVTLVFVTVPGKVKENMTLQKFGAYRSEDNGTTGSYIYLATNEQPNMMAFALKNEGNVFEAPSGSITITDIFGHHVATVDANPSQNLALIGQTRLYTSCIKTKEQAVQALGGTSKDTTCVSPDLKPGFYTAKLDVLYGGLNNSFGSATNPNQEIVATVHFWYLPWWFIILVLIILALIAFGIWWLQRKIRAAVKGTSYKAGRGISRRSPK